MNSPLPFIIGFAMAALLFHYIIEVAINPTTNIIGEKCENNKMVYVLENKDMTRSLYKTEIWCE